MDLKVSHVVENLKSNFGIECKGSPFLVHINLSNMEGKNSYNLIADLRFNINAIKNNKEDAEAQVKELKEKVKKNDNVRWNETWEEAAIKVFFEEYKSKFQKMNASSIDRAECVNKDNRLTKVKKQTEHSKKLREHCDALYDMGFRYLRNVRGDGNCYYRAVMYGYFETLLSGDEKLIDSFIRMLKEDKEYFSCGKNEIRHKEGAIKIIERIAKVKKELGTQRALNEYFLESVASDYLNYVIHKLNNRY